MTPTDLQAEVDAGLSATAIARKYKVCVQTICARAKRWKIDVVWRRGTRHWRSKVESEEDMKLALALVDEGLSVTEAADKMEISRSALYNAYHAITWRHI